MKLKIFLIFIVFAQTKAHFCRQDRVENFGEVYECNLVIRRVNSNQSEEIEITDEDHKPGKTNNDVEFLWISDRNSQTLTKGLDLLFPNLKGIYAGNNGIKLITKEDFNFLELQHISLVGNELTTLEDDLFALTPNLQYVNLSLNKIKTVGTNTFKHLKNLTYLGFIYNTCYDLHAETSKTRYKVEKLILDLLIFCPNNSEMQPEATIFDCYYSSNFLYKCEAIVKKFIELGQSKITAVSHNHVEGKGNNDVEHLRFTLNNFTSFPSGIEQFFPNLRSIFAMHNHIKTVAKENLNFPRLEYIDFGDNELTTLDDDLFSFTPNLRHVDFYFNSIKHVGMNTFAPLKNLTKLYFYDGKNCVNDRAETHEEVENLISKFLASCPPIAAL